MMQLFRPKQNQDKVRFIAMMESGVLVDETADIVQTQVIAHKAKSSIRNRDAVPVYYQLEEDAPPVWKENAIIETGVSAPPGMESRHVLEDAPNLWMGYQTGTVDSGRFSLEGKHLGLIALGASVVVFVIMAWLTSLSLSDPVEVATDGEVIAGPNLGAEEGAHGFVQEEAAGETAGQEAAPAIHEGGPAEEGAELRPADAGGTAVPVGAGPEGTVPAGHVAPGDGDGGPQPQR